MPVQQADHNYDSLNQNLHPLYRPDPSAPHTLSSQNNSLAGDDDGIDTAALHHQPPSMSSPHLPLLPATTYSPPRATRQNRLSLTTGLVDQGPSHDPNARDELSPDPREFYLQYHDPFGSDGAGPDDVDLSTASYSRRSSGPSNGSPVSQRYKSSSRAHQFRSTSGSHPNDLSPRKQRRAPITPSDIRNRQSSLKELVDRFNQTRDEVPPRPPARSSLTSTRAESPTPVSKSYGRTNTRTSVSNRGHQAAIASNNAASIKESGLNNRIPQNPVRKPLFGEILSLDTFAAHQERRRTSHQRRGSDSCMPSPGPMFLDIPSDVSAGWSPTSPTAWYLGYNPSIDTTKPINPPLLHRRSRSDLGGHCSQSMSPASFNPNMALKSPVTSTSSLDTRRKPGSQSRIPVATRRFSQTSDSGNSSPSTRTNSALDRHPANISLPPKGTSALPKPSPKPNASPRFRSPSNSPITPRFTSPRRRDGGHAHNLQPLKSPTLKAIITAPPPKISPPLRSSRPRQPVSAATTSASRAKVVDRISDFQISAMPLKSPRATRTKSRRLPELGNVDFAARRQRIQQAFNKSIEESNKKEIAKKAQREARLKEAEKKGGQPDHVSQQPEERPGAVPERIPAETQTSAAESPDMAEEQEIFVTPEEGRSPTLAELTENVTSIISESQKPVNEEPPAATERLNIPDTHLTVVRPSSACSDTLPQSAITAMTDTTPIDIEPQTDFPQPLQSHRTMLSHIMQMRESSPDTTDSSDDEEASSSSGRDKESIQIMLRQTYFDPIDTSSETQEFAEDADESRAHNDQQRWSMSSWSSSIQIQNHQLVEESTSLDGKVETLADEDRASQSICTSERAVTPQPQLQESSASESAASKQEQKPEELAEEAPKQQARPAERFSLNLMHRYPDLAKQARWDTKRATQLYLQELAKAGYGQPRIPEPVVKKVEEEKKRVSIHSAETLQEDGLAEDAVMLPESKSIPPSDYVQHLASLSLRDDWERASPSIADWMHLAATDKEETDEHREDDALVPERDDAVTPKISTTGPSNSSSALGTENGLGVSIHIQSPQGDSPTIPELPSYPPPPPPASLSGNTSAEKLQQPPPVQALLGVYSQSPSSAGLSGSTLVLKDYEGHARTGTDASLQTTSTRSTMTFASSATLQGRQSFTHGSIEAASPRKSPTPEQRRLKKRLLVIKELVDTEYTFGQDMTVVVDIYKGTSSSCGLTPEDVKSLFGNSEHVVKFSMDFQDALKHAAKSVYLLPKSQRWLSKRGSRYIPSSNSQENSELSDDEKDRRTTIGQAFMGLIGRMEKVYSEYLKNHDAANKTLDSLLKNKNKHVNIWLKECRDWASDLTTAWNLDSLLVKPVQRILKYPLLLTELLSSTPTDHPDHAAIANALRETTAMSVRINDMKKRADVVGQVISSRKRKESDVRAGLSKAFGRRTEKLKQHVGLSEMFTDKEYDVLSQKFGDNFFQLQLIMRDVELYTTEVQNSMNKFNEFIIAIEAYMTIAPSNYPELESKWCRFRLAVKDMMTVALADHLASVRKSVINPMVTLLKLHDGPQRVMQKRNKRLLDYVKYKAVKDRGDKPDKKTSELGEQFIALNITLKEELPKLLSLTGKLMEACLNNFVQIQTVWHTLVQKRLGYTIDRMPQDVGQIISDWSGDFTFSEAQVLSLGVCNGTVLADTANVHNYSTPSTSHGVETASSRRPSSTTTRTFSLDHGASPKISVEVGAHTPTSFMQSSSHGENFMHHTNGSYSYVGGRSRTNSNFSSSHVPSVNTIMNSSRSSITPSTGTTSNTSFRTSDASPLLPQLSLETPRFPEFFPDPLAPGNGPVNHVHRRGGPDLTEHPSSPDAPRYSGFFSSAMPMAESPMPPESQPVLKEPKVLFLAASMFEFNIDRARREAGYPYLTYVAGEIFDVIGEKGDLWLARNQDDPTHQVGWIWTKHFAKLAG
ncbi:hypothetical protein PRK78_005540 [Emydomyces testavorans]|uniref:DH domain-containing protein n=1 Tax=Emydomyces testavorans TaxID=2070801 RepID=A0AAF0IKT9_9EURO|nr:hypothetical protein PRK78_005540 [Emydomyces testavorans]